ncbi:MAG: hypothetical protein WCP86_12240 [bacterium]
MSADILIDDHLTWSVSTSGFCDLMSRARKGCTDEDAAIADLFAFAEVVGCLNIQRYSDPAMRTKLLKYLQAAAEELVSELGALSTQREETNHISDLLVQIRARQA